MLPTQLKKGNAEILVSRTIDGTWLCVKQKASLHAGKS